MTDSDPPVADATPPAGHALATAPALLHATVTVTRKLTGKIDTYHLVGTIADEDDNEPR